MFTEVVAIEGNRVGMLLKIILGYLSRTYKI